MQLERGFQAAETLTRRLVDQPPKHPLDEQPWGWVCRAPGQCLSGGYRWTHLRHQCRAPGPCPNAPGLR